MQQSATPKKGSSPGALHRFRITLEVATTCDKYRRSSFAQGGFFGIDGRAAVTGQVAAKPCHAETETNGASGEALWSALTLRKRINITSSLIITQFRT